MKLSQIYANKKFKAVRFNEDLNVILGTVTQPSDSTKDSHNLGKTTLIYLIDFLLLKRLVKGHFLYDEKELFKEYIFFLEIQLNSGKYLTIRRSVETNTKISFKFHDEKYQNLKTSTKWDAFNIPIDKAKQILNSNLSFDVLKEYSYRDSVSYFLRTQEDYLDVFQLNKYTKSDHVNWKPLLFEMLGFDSKPIIQKYEIDKEIDNVKNAILIIQKNSATKSEDLDKLKGLIEIKEEEKNTIVTQIDDFNFYQTELLINEELIDQVETKISQNNSLRYKLSFEADKIKESLKNKVEFNLENIEKIFGEVKVYFPDNLKKDYTALQEFNKELYEERYKHLQERSVQIKATLEQINYELEDLDRKRVTLLKVLKDKDSFTKYKQYQNEKVKIEAEIIRLEEKLQNVTEIESLNDVIENLVSKQEDLKKAIKKQVNETINPLYSDIRKNFYHIVKETLSSPAIISTSINKEGNVEFQANIQNETETGITSKGKGTSYKKFLCMAFDIAILVAYSSKSFFKFVYHDGVFEGLDNRKKNKFIELVKSLCKHNNIQYVLTSIQSDMPRDEHDNIVPFKTEEIVLELDDSGDEGRLFQQSF